VALPIGAGRPRRRLSFPIEVVLVAVAACSLIFLILSMVTRIGVTVR